MFTQGNVDAVANNLLSGDTAYNYVSNILNKLQMCIK